MIHIVKWLLILLLTTLSLFAQDTFSNKEGSKYQFTLLKDLEATKVENQNRTGTCWSFSALSYFESEIIRLGHKPVDLSEMYVVRNAFIGKAVNYLRMNGHSNFAAGGAFHDIPWVIKRYGIVPQEEYLGLNYGYEVHNHNEMEAALKGMLDGFKKKKQDKKLTKNWQKAFTRVVDTYLGDLPADITHYTFTEEGVTYNPITYAKKLGINMDDYIGLTSFTHHPFYSSFVLEVPDNWALQSSYNLPIDELMQVMEDAINNGFTFAWGADVSEKGFSAKDALAILPEDAATIQEKDKEDEFFKGEDDKKIPNAFVQPVKERWVSQTERQEAFDEQTTTDDHGMHITGIIKDQKGTKYYLVKNSWGTEYNQRDGYFYASFPYVRYKTLNIMIHKDALSKSLRKKLNL